jgi:deoxycytidylate deaminase
MIINAGIVRVQFKNCYPDALARAMFDEAGIEIGCSKN